MSTALSPLARLNVSDGITTPLAQTEYERYFDVLGGKPVHATLATHWARLIELLYAAEHELELAQDEEILTKMCAPSRPPRPTEGVAIVEAPRGTLTHHYVTDERGLLKSGQPDRRHHQQLCRH